MDGTNETSFYTKAELDAQCEALNIGDNCGLDKQGVSSGLSVFLNSQPNPAFEEIWSFRVGPILKNWFSKNHL